MGEFKVGARVKIIAGAYNMDGAEGTFGTIVKRGELNYWKWIVNVEFPGTQSDELGFNEDELELAPAQPAASAPDGASVFDLLERRIMKSGDTRYLEGIDEPIGLETAKYINNQSIALHDAKKVAESFAGILDEKYQLIKELQTELVAYGDGYAAGMLDGPNYAPLMNEIAALKAELAREKAALAAIADTEPYMPTWYEYTKKNGLEPLVMTTEQREAGYNIWELEYQRIAKWALQASAPADGGEGGG